MTKFIKKLLFKILGAKKYLSLISGILLRMLSFGFYKNHRDYQELHFLKEIVSEGNYCVDIGANLGYFSVSLAKIVGKKGHVFAVEPIPLYKEVLQKNLRKFRLKNVTIHNVALGDQEKTVEMGVPVLNGIMRHGLTQVTEVGNFEYSKTFTVPMKKPDELFSDLPKIDFLKVDVEGYEAFVMENFVETLKKHKPLIQIELVPKDVRVKVLHLMKSLGYKLFVLQNKKLVEYDFQKAEDDRFMNYFFNHPENSKI